MLHTPIECACGLRITMDQMATHLQVECSRRKVVCRFCGLSTIAGPPPEDHKDRLNGLTTHESECGSRTETCPECGKYVRIKEMDAHLAYHQFLHTQQTCQPVPVSSPAPSNPEPAAPVLCCNEGCGREGIKPRGLCSLCEPKLARVAVAGGDTRAQAQARSPPRLWHSQS